MLQERVLRQRSVALAATLAVAWLSVAGCSSEGGNPLAARAKARQSSGAVAPQEQEKGAAMSREEAAVMGAADAAGVYATASAPAAPEAEKAYAPARARSLSAAQSWTAAMPMEAKSAAAPMPAPAAVQSPNLYVASNYQGGSGERERMEKLIREGVLVDGKRVQLEAFTREYEQDFPIPTREALSLSAGTERTKLLTQGGRTFLQVGLQAIKGEAPRRPPLNVSLVMDVSGSMNGENKFEDAKRAARELVKRLRPDDVFALTVFDDEARVLLPAGRANDKARLLAKIDSLYTGGGTNIYDGLKLGYREAAKSAAREGGVSLVLLLSDGEVTAGVKDPAAFQRLVAENADAHDVQTSTVGVGVDYNEELMLSLAQEGKGNYHFLKDGGDAPQVFARELDDLLQIVAKAVKVRIALAPGVGFVRVLGTRALSAGETQKVKADEKKIDARVAEELGIVRDRQRDDDREPGIKMLIPNFHRGDSHVILVEVTVPQGAESQSRKVADVHLKYKDLTRPANRVASTSSSVSYTTELAESVGSIDRGVKKNLLGFQTGEALRTAADRMGRGDVAGAVRVVDERMVVLGVAAREWNDRDLDRDGRLLDRYKTVLALAARDPQMMARAGLGDYLQKSLTYNAYQMTR